MLSGSDESLFVCTASFLSARSEPNDAGSEARAFSEASRVVREERSPKDSGRAARELDCRLSVASL